MPSITNGPKFTILLVAVIGVVVLMALGRVSSDAGMFFIGSATGIGIGNGIAAKRGEQVGPVFGWRARRER